MYFPYLYFGLLLGLTGLSLQAQYTQYRQNRPPMWKNPQPQFAPTDSAFLGADAVIVSEQTEWRMNDLERTTTVKKQLAIRFLTPRGIALHNRITIPECTDPAYDYADLPIEKRDPQQLHRPKYFDLELLYWSARLVKPDGTVQLLTCRDSIETEELFFNSRNFYAYSYAFSCPQIEVGDVLEVQYQYFLPYLFDQKRLFFHGKLPKQHYQISIIHHPREYYVWQPQNGAVCTDSVKTDKEVRHTWQYDKLPACLYETNARPYRDLPHLQYYIHNKNYGLWNEFYATDFMPYSWQYYMHDWVGFRQSVRYKQKIRLNRKEVALNNLYRAVADTMGDDAAMRPLRCWAQLQRHLNDDFDYYAQADAYANIDPRLSRLSRESMRRLMRNINRAYVYHGLFDRIYDLDNLGTNPPNEQLSVESSRGIADNRLETVAAAIDRKRLENTNADAIYTGLLNRVDAPYNRVLLNDQRIAALKPDVCTPIWGENRWLAIQADSALFYINPKTRRFGYHLNELPFYLENTVSVHAAQLTDSYQNPTAVQLYQTPYSTAADNKRTTDVNMKIDTHTREAICEARILLSGQYATLLRESYLYGTRDSSVNRQYYQRPNQLSHKSTAAAPIVESSDEQFPYRTQVKLTYADPTLLQTIDDSTYVLSLRNWIPMVLPEPDTTQTRHLPYYTDFIGSDTYRYLISFDYPVRLLPDAAHQVTWHNQLGTYRLHISQSSPTTLQLYAELHIAADRVLPQDIGDVAQICQAIAALSGQTIQLRLVK